LWICFEIFGLNDEEHHEAMEKEDEEEKQKLVGGGTLSDPIVMQNLMVSFFQ
jgi:hypothetical protein